MISFSPAAIFFSANSKTPGNEDMKPIDTVTHIAAELSNSYATRLDEIMRRYLDDTGQDDKAPTELWPQRMVEVLIDIADRFYQPDSTDTDDLKNRLSATWHLPSNWESFFTERPMIMASRRNRLANGWQATKLTKQPLRHSSVHNPL